MLIFILTIFIPSLILIFGGMPRTGLWVGALAVMTLIQCMVTALACVILFMFGGTFYVLEEIKFLSTHVIYDNTINTIGQYLLILVPAAWLDVISLLFTIAWRMDSIFIFLMQFFVGGILCLLVMGVTRNAVMSISLQMQLEERAKR